MPTYIRYMPGTGVSNGKAGALGAVEPQALRLVIRAIMGAILPNIFLVPIARNHIFAVPLAFNNTFAASFVFLTIHLQSHLC